MRSGASGALADVADAQSDDPIGLVLLDGVTHPASGPLKGDQRQRGARPIPEYRAGWLRISWCVPAAVRESMRTSAGHLPEDAAIFPLLSLPTQRLHLPPVHLESPTLLPGALSCLACDR